MAPEQKEDRLDLISEIGGYVIYGDSDDPSERDAWVAARVDEAIELGRRTGPVRLTNEGSSIQERLKVLIHEVEVDLYELDRLHDLIDDAERKAHILSVQAAKRSVLTPLKMIVDTETT